MFEDFERSHVEAFFRKIADRYHVGRTLPRDSAGALPEPRDSHHVAAVVITHLLADRPVFLRAIARLATIVVVLPKPKSVNEEALAEISILMPVDRLNRTEFADGEHVLAFLETRAAGKDLVLLDVGGYFAPSLQYVCSHFSGRVIGVVEDTENGHQRYATAAQALGKLPCPVLSVARSPLKDPD